MHPKAMLFPGISVSQKCNPIYKKINFLGAQLDAPEVEISLDVMENPRSELLTRVIRGVGGWFKKPKKCLTPSENESSGNRLKIGQIPVQT